MKATGLCGLVLALALWHGAALADEDEPWQPTSETKRFDASAAICMGAKAKAKAEAEMQRERAYSKRYGVTDLGKLNFFKDSIMEADARTASAMAALRKAGQRAVPCSSPLLAEFIECLAAEDDPDFVALSSDERFENCHRRGFGIPAVIAPSRSVSAEDFSDEDLGRLAEKVVPGKKDLRVAQDRMAKAGLEPERMEMALVCSSDLSILARRPFTSVVSDLVDVLALRSPTSAAKRLRLSNQDAFGRLLNDYYTDVNTVARLVDDRGFAPGSILSSICWGVAAKEDGRLGVISARAKKGGSTEAAN